MTTETRTAVLAGGCFWGLEDLVRKQPGVLDTEVGYTGGRNDHPTYRNHPGHAEALKITANDLHELNLVDEVVPEPLGGAHNDHDAMADTLRDALLRNLNELEQIDPEIRLQERYAKYRRHGKYIEG